MFKIFIFALIHQYATYHISVLTSPTSQFQSSVISVNFRELKFKIKGRGLSTVCGAWLHSGEMPLPHMQSGWSFLF